MRTFLNRCFLPVAFLLTALDLRANEIDGLMSREDVRQFLVKRVSKDYKKTDLFAKPYDGDSTAYSGQFFKMDIDGNGLTDLIVNGRDLQVVMDWGRGKYGVVSPDRFRLSFWAVHLGGLDSTGGVRKLITRMKWDTLRMRDNHPVPIELDTLVWWRGGFIEYDPAPVADFRFESISVSTTRCFGTCPVFTMTVNADGSARYEAIQFEDQLGVFTGTVPAKNVSSMIDLLKHIPVDRLASQYAVDWTDDQTINVEIRYNGKVRQLSDYGLCGTFGLNRLYSYFFGWRKTVEWND